MWRVARTTLAACVLAITLPIAQAQEQAMTQAMEPAASGHVEINGVDYHYQIHGEGEPLLLLHGGLGTLDMFVPILPILTATREVVGIDLHGHGRTPLGDRAIDLVEMGGDLARVVETLGYEQIDVMGYSMGGGVAAQIALQNPDLVRRLVLVSTPAAKDGFYPDIVDQMHQISAQMADAMQGTPMNEAYAAVAPVADDFPRLLDAMGDMVRRPDVYELEVEKLTMPVMLIYGDGDMFRLEHVVEFYRRLGGGQGDAGWMRENMPINRLAILPDLTHYEIFMSPVMVETALRFLDGDNSAPVWRHGEEYFQ
jgi:pimeloyl-ACP methyl ester carboxylesterase